MHDYYLVTLSESLIFLGFSMVSAFDLMGVIWREKLKMSRKTQSHKPLILLEILVLFYKNSIFLNVDI